MDTASTPLRSAARRLDAAAFLALFAAFVAGCATQPPATDAAEKAAAAENAKSLGQVAELVAIGGSAVTGKVRVVDRGDGATLTVTAFNLPIGEYRVTINANGNCTSPNGFSAGSAWAPPDVARAPADLVGVLATGESGSANATVHVRGLRATGPDGAAGRSAVIYAGRKVTAAVPDVPNERIACGVFEPAQSLSF